MIAQRGARLMPSIRDLMPPEILDRLRARSATIHVRWEALLRIEPVASPLANPDALSRLIPDSIARVFATLAGDKRAPITLREARADHLPPCDCGHNPYKAYFVAGEQAFVEAVVWLQAEAPHEAHPERDVADVIRAVRQLGRNEIDTFCGICVHHSKAVHCRHTPAATPV